MEITKELLLANGWEDDTGCTHCVESYGYMLEKDWHFRAYIRENQVEIELDLTKLPHIRTMEHLAALLFLLGNEPEGVDAEADRIFELGLMR